MVYEVMYINKTGNDNRTMWEEIPCLYINNYPWGRGWYKPITEVRMFYTEEHINLKFTSDDIHLKAIFENQNDTVCKDNCVEFFFNPNPKYDSRYINIEMNVIGAARIGIGTNRENRKLLNPNLDIFKIKTTVNKNNISSYKKSNWSVEYCIPFCFIERLYGKVNIHSGSIIKGNFYKCGDDTKYPHFGCWNPIMSSYPDFHRPEFFGDIVFL